MDLRSYTDTRMEVMLLESRIEFLENKKTEIYTRYFGLKSPQWDKVPAGGSVDQDKHIQYLTEMSKAQSNGLTIEEELEIDRLRLAKAKKILAKMEKALKSLNGVEYQLYYEIVVNELSVNQAAEKIAAANYMSISNIYHNYYPRIRDDIHKLRTHNKK